MTKSVLAVYTFNQFIAPYNSPAIKGFREAEPGAFSELERSYGFIARSGYDGDEGPDSWGTQVFPSCWTDNGDGFAPSTLSLWVSLEALMAATYHGAHGQAFKQGHLWHDHNSQLPGSVFWWVLNNHQPDWSEAVDRFEKLRADGPSPEAFTAKNAFDPNGQPYSYDAKRVRDLAVRNKANAPADRVS
ncbi:MAG: DUF3291 domain-containing protein [Roseibium sp.]